MVFVQQALRQRRVADAVGLYRAARGLWPSAGIFGKDDIAAEDEFLEIRAIYFTDLEKNLHLCFLKQIEKIWKKYREQEYGPELEEDYDAEQDKLGEEGSLSDPDDVQSRAVEIDFHFNEYVAKFARVDVLKWLSFQ
ncbi:unnamed protein product [Gongylonema pulchrum]|uniref:HAT family dimerization domain containing protein n=1 Tax=Gongylonema pulchrum TaxID=637853 RepID=A0A183D0P4_9BILA|nr:unnamed protein product [Gongylonema pulchrum]